MKASTFISSNSRGRGRGRGRGRADRGNRDRGNKEGCGNFRGNDYGKGRGRNFDKSKVECNRCHKFGHYRSECYTRLPNEKQEKSNFVENKEGETLLMAVHVEKKPNQQALWYADTGYSNHMTGSKSSFTYLNESFQSTVSFGDLSTVNVMGKGNINFRTKNGCVEIISNVFYVPALKSNLLSVGQLLEKGYVIILRNDACEISDSSKGIIAIVKMSQNRLFPLKN